MLYPDGSCYKGSWKNDKWNGVGKFYDSNGKVTHAYYK